MRIVEPVDVSETALTTSDVPIDDYPVWAAGTYTLGQRVVNGIEAWEVVAASTAEEPDTSSLDWLRLGYVNRWRMFRDGRDSPTTQLDAVNIELDFPSLVSAVTLLGVVGAEVQLTVTDSVEGIVYDETASIVDIGVVDWWEYFFLPYDQSETYVFDGIPPYPGAAFELAVRAADPASPAAVGRMVAGIDRELGVTVYGTSVSIIDYSIKERDGFGNLTLVPRRTIRTTSYDAVVSSARVGFIQNRLSRLASTPTLFIGDTLYESTVTFGVYRDFTETISSPSNSELTIDVEGF